MEPVTASAITTGDIFSRSVPELRSPNNGETFKLQHNHLFLEDVDSSCSTPFVSAPSSPGRGSPVGFFYSAPASPMHFVLSSTAAKTITVQPPLASVSSSGDVASVSGSFEFDFSSRLGSSGGSGASMCSADELFFNGQIRPMKLSTHLQRPQVLAPLLDVEEGEIANDAKVEVIEAVRGRDLRLRDRSLRRRTRSMSPLRSLPFPWQNDDDDDGDDESKDLKAKELESDKVGLELKRKEGKDEEEEGEARSSMESTPSMSASSSRSSSGGRSSKRWVFLKDFLYRSKSEGRSSSTKFWSSMTFVPGKEKKSGAATTQINPLASSKEKATATQAEAAPKTKRSAKEASKKKKKAAGKFANGVGKRRVPPSPHELHYTANRAQAEELRRKTYLPYRQGLLGCLGFSSKSYGAINGFARALNPVSSR